MKYIASQHTFAHVLLPRRLYLYLNNKTEKMLKAKCFEERINLFTLHFRDSRVEADFVQSRRRFERLPKIYLYLLMILGVCGLVMFIFEIVRYSMMTDDKMALVSRIIACGCYIVIMGVEWLACRWDCLAFIRSIPIHVYITVIVYYSSYNDYAARTNFPVVDVWYRPSCMILVGVR